MPLSSVKQSLQTSETNWNVYATVTLVTGHHLPTLVGTIVEVIDDRQEFVQRRQNIPRRHNDRKVRQTLLPRTSPLPVQQNIVADKEN